MTCERIEFVDGGSGFLCGSGKPKRAPNCACGAISSLLCKHPLGPAGTGAPVVTHEISRASLLARIAGSWPITVPTRAQSWGP
jgi:hypothetical protein